MLFAGLEMSSADAYLNEGVTLLSCRLLHVGTWTSISVFNHNANGNKSRLLIAYNDSSTPVIEKSVSSRLRATTDKPSKYEVLITLWMYSLGCDDEGNFSCTADVPFAVPEVFGRLNIKGMLVIYLRGSASWFVDFCLTSYSRIFHSYVDVSAFMYMFLKWK